jgi:hypothetical protein
MSSTSEQERQTACKHCDKTFEDARYYHLGIKHDDGSVAFFCDETCAIDYMIYREKLIARAVQNVLSVKDQQINGLELTRDTMMAQFLILQQALKSLNASYPSNTNSTQEIRKEEGAGNK